MLPVSIFVLAMSSLPLVYAQSDDPVVQVSAPDPASNLAKDQEAQHTSRGAAGPSASSLDQAPETKPSQTPQSQQKSKEGKVRKNLSEELRAIESDVNQAWRGLYGETHAYFRRGTEAYRDVNFKVKDTILGATYSAELENRRDHWRLLAGVLDLQVKVLKILDTFLDSVERGQPQMPRADLIHVKEELPGFEEGFRLREDFWADSPRDSRTNAINREFKEYDRKIQQLILELIRKEPDKAKYWTQIAEVMGLESFRRMLALVKKSHEPIAKATKATIDYVERNHLVSADGRLAIAPR